MATPSGRSQATDFINKELVKLLYQNSGFALLATALIAPALGFMFWQPSRTISIGLWLSAITAVTAWRYHQLRRYNRTLPGIKKTHHWERLYLVGVVLAGCLWGSTPFVLLDTPSDIEHWFILLFVLTGLAGGSLTTLSANRLAYALFVLPAMSPLVLRDWLLQPMFGHAPSILIPLFIGLTLVVSQRTYAFILSTLETRYRSDSLLMQLEQGNTELKTLYQISIEAEDRANRANILFEQVFGTTHVLYALLDADFNFIQVNRAYAEAGNKTPEDFIGKNHFELYPDEDNQAIFRRVLQTGEPYHASARRFQHPERGDSYWDWTLQPLQPHNEAVQGLLLTLQDVTKQQKTALALAEQEHRLRSIMETAIDAIVITDSHGIIEACNPATETTFGYSAEDLVGQSINMLMPDHHRRRHDAYVKSYLDTSMPRIIGRSLETQGQRKDGTVFPLEVTVTDTEVDGEHLLMGVMRDISAQKSLLEKLEKQNEELRYQSSHDTLTSLMNRRYADDYIATEWARAQRNQSELSVFIIDVDFFKLYNDNYGHQAGDACLQRLARIFDEELQRPSDIIARYGGEEFIAILPDTPIEGACNVAEVIRQSVADAGIPHKYSSVADVVTVSIGISSAKPLQGQRFEAVVSHADEALYQAKREGRNRIICKAHTAE